MQVPVHQQAIPVAVVLVLVVGSLLVDVSGAWFQFSELLLQFSDCDNDVDIVDDGAVSGIRVIYRL